MEQIKTSEIEVGKKALNTQTSNLTRYANCVAPWKYVYEKVECAMNLAVHKPSSNIQVPSQQDGFQKRSKNHDSASNNVACVTVHCF
eukprot:3476356-Amphidinium_carterae.2